MVAQDDAHLQSPRQFSSKCLITEMLRRHVTNSGITRKAAGLSRLIAPTERNIGSGPRGFSERPVL